MGRRDQSRVSKTTTTTYPSASSSLNFAGTDEFHHFQSPGFLANLFPLAVLIKVESFTSNVNTITTKRQEDKAILTRSNPAIFRLFIAGVTEASCP